MGTKDWRNSKRTSLVNESLANFTSKSLVKEMEFLTNTVWGIGIELPNLLNFSSTKLASFMVYEAKAIIYSLQCDIQQL